MARKYSDLGTTQNEAVGVQDRVSGASASGTLHVAQVTYTLDGTETSSDDVGLMRIPQGAVIIPALSQVIMEAAAADALTVDIGVDYDDASLTADLDKLADGVSLSAGANAFTAGVGLLTPTEETSAGWLVRDFKTATNPVADKKLTVFLVFSLNG